MQMTKVVVVAVAGNLYIMVLNEDSRKLHNTALVK